MAPLSLRIEIGRYGSSDEQRRGEGKTEYRVLIKPRRASVMGNRDSLAGH